VIFAHVSRCGGHVLFVSTEEASDGRNVCSRGTRSRPVDGGGRSSRCLLCAVEAFARLLWIAVTPGATHGERKALWRRFGMWLLLGLEFELAADIIASVISPTWQDIGERGAIAVIRTFLNYFLEKDLEHAEATGAAPEMPAAVLRSASRKGEEAGV
jgi:uncharacterized membrane protein